jgi:hypothetical protein
LRQGPSPEEEPEAWRRPSLSNRRRCGYGLGAHGHRTVETADDLLAERAKLNARLQAILDEQTEVWGVKVTQVQVKQVDLPQEMQRAIAAQAEAERTRRAKIIAAQGEFQAATKLAEAAAVLNREPVSVTLRYLQTLIEIGTEQNTTIVFPLPLDLLGLNRHAVPVERGRPSASQPPGAGASRGAHLDGSEAHHTP